MSKVTVVFLKFLNVELFDTGVSILSYTAKNIILIHVFISLFHVYDYAVIIQPFINLCLHLVSWWIY